MISTLAALNMRVFSDISKNVLPKRKIWAKFKLLSLRENCPHSELFWSVFSRIRTEYGEIESECGEIRTRITPNTTQKGATMILKQGAVEKKMHICFGFTAIRTKWIQSILKAMFKCVVRQMTWNKAQSCQKVGSFTAWRRFIKL